MKYCGKCGSELSDEALFCTECGDRVRQDISNNIPPAQGCTQRRKPSLAVIIGYAVSAILIFVGAAFVIASFFK